MQEYEPLIPPEEQLSVELAIQGLISDNISNINTAFLAEVQAVNENSVDVFDIIKDKDNSQNPVITNALIGIPNNGGNGLSFGITKGTIGVCLCIKKDISLYKQNGGECVKNSDRLFSTNDAIFIPLSLKDQTKINEVGLKLTSDKASLEFDNQSNATLSGELISIKSAQTSLFKMLDALADFLMKAKTINGGPFTADDIAVITKWKTELTTLFVKEETSNDNAQVGSE